MFGWVPGREGYQPFRRLFDCALWKHNLRATCRSCKHTRVLDGPGLWWLAEKRSWDDDLRAFSHRLYCGPCYLTHSLKVRVPMLTPTQDEVKGPLLPGPSHYEWKRIVNRQRS
jgi:hypothetical protein